MLEKSLLQLNHTSIYTVRALIVSVNALPGLVTAVGDRRKDLHPTLDDIGPILPNPSILHLLTDQGDIKRHHTRTQHIGRHAHTDNLQHMEPTNLVVIPQRHLRHRTGGRRKHISRQRARRNVIVLAIPHKPHHHSTPSRNAEAKSAWLNVHIMLPVIYLRVILVPTRSDTPAPWGQVVHGAFTPPGVRYSICGVRRLV